jgi:superfamily II DNA helicase RecQ
MKCRTLSIRIEQPFAAIDEAAASEFLASVKVRKVTAGICERPEPCWSLLVLFDEDAAGRKATPVRDALPAEARPRRQEKAPVEAAAAVPDEQPEKPLTARQERMVVSLKAWRSERAASDRVPPYCVMPNRSIEEIARLRPSTAEDLAGVSGFGPSRLEKYASDVLELVGRKNGRKKS